MNSISQPGYTYTQIHITPPDILELCLTVDKHNRSEKCQLAFEKVILPRDFFKKTRLKVLGKTTCLKMQKHPVSSSLHSLVRFPRKLHFLDFHRKSYSLITPSWCNKHPLLLLVHILPQLNSMVQLLIMKTSHL